MRNTLLIILIIGISCATDNEVNCWIFLKQHGLTDAGAAGLMGNLKAESGIKSVIYEHKYEPMLNNMTAQEYVDQVNQGIYTNFTKDKVGFGLAQWTSERRKTNLLEACKGKIGDFQCQLDFLMTEFQTTERFIPILSLLKTSNDVRNCTVEVMVKFEVPKDQSDEKKDKRTRYSMAYYEEFKGQGSSNTTSDTSDANVKQSYSFYQQFSLIGLVLQLLFQIF